jgi:hypothetical protein
MKKELDSFATKNFITTLKLTCNETTFNCIIVPFIPKYNQDVENLKKVRIER